MSTNLASAVWGLIYRAFRAFKVDFGLLEQDFWDFGVIWALFEQDFGLFGVTFMNFRPFNVDLAPLNWISGLLALLNRISGLSGGILGLFR